MHYYKRNIGDYAKKAGRLSMLEHGSYTLLIDACYDREQFPTIDEAIDWTWARTDDEIAAVKFVLSKFFTLIDGRYVQNRIKEELDSYKAKAETNARIAKQREENRKRNERMGKDSAKEETNRQRTVNEPPPNHKPLTNNQEPLTNNKNTLSKNENEKKLIFDETDWTDQTKPSLDEINQVLSDLQIETITQHVFDKIYAQFVLKNGHKPMAKGARMSSLSNWVRVNHQQKKSKPKLTKSRTTPIDQSARQTETPVFAERQFSDYSDGEVYSCGFTAGHIRRNLRQGEKPDECVFRLSTKTDQKAWSEA